MHDLNSVALLRDLKHPVVVCVVNNSGGGIFSFLPISKRKEAFEEYIAAAHELTFEAVGMLFDIPYFHPQSLEEFREFLSEQKTNPCSCIVEITTNREENVCIHESIIAAINSCLNPLQQEIPANLH